MNVYVRGLCHIIPAVASRQMSRVNLIVIGLINVADDTVTYLMCIMYVAFFAAHWNVAGGLAVRSFEITEAN